MTDKVDARLLKLEAVHERRKQVIQLHRRGIVSASMTKLIRIRESTAKPLISRVNRSSMQQTYIQPTFVHS